MERGLTAVQEFYDSCRLHHTDDIIAIGTAALRVANNRQVFLEKVREEYGIKIQVLNGEEEVNLIYRGVSKASFLRL